MNTNDEGLLVQIASYNTNLQGNAGLPQDLVDWLSPTLQVSGFLSREKKTPDVVAVGFQELLPLNFGCMFAHNLQLAGSHTFVHSGRYLKSCHQLSGQAHTLRTGKILADQGKLFTRGQDRQRWHCAPSVCTRRRSRTSHSGCPNLVDRVWPGLDGEQGGRWCTFSPSWTRRRYRGDIHVS